jgi:hypothetical protein
MPSWYASYCRGTHLHMGPLIRCCSSERFASQFHHRGQSGRRWTHPHHRVQLRFRRAYQRPKISHPMVTASCVPRLLRLKSALNASWTRFRRSKPLLFSQSQPVRRCSHQRPPSAAATGLPAANWLGFRSLVVARFFSCAASAWSSTESSRPVCQAEGQCQ